MMEPAFAGGWPDGLGAPRVQLGYHRMVPRSRALWIEQLDSSYLVRLVINVSTKISWWRVEKVVYKCQFTNTTHPGWYGWWREYICLSIIFDQHTFSNLTSTQHKALSLSSISQNIVKTCSKSHTVIWIMRNYLSRQSVCPLPLLFFASCENKSVWYCTLHKRHLLILRYKL